MYFYFQKNIFTTSRELISTNPLQLVDVPEMQYFASQNNGKVCVRGSNVFHGYYKDPGKLLRLLTLKAGTTRAMWARGFQMARCT
ncbi:long-chain-fatty-acid--CoA ligase 1-like [Anastrepha obliqua]|uniref:long-chain-fatty-acid--CoA ligase 1-like n=1 Tax=Anastrepha obliqua TaxID=95512 RepID=UPI00240A0EB5|nr:long-chain-fatty-acid--CoA ligase 1-like [Anastrepha obliqua]